MLALLFVAAVAQAGPPLLWDKAHAGMTMAEVQKTYPEAVSGDGYWCALKIKERQIAGYPMQVCFGFPQSGPLNNVVLEQDGQAAYDDIVRAFTTKYGPAAQAEKCEEGLVPKCVILWMHGKITIKVTRMNGVDTFITYDAVNASGL